MIAVCPRCDCALVVLTWRDLDVDICPTCRGMWLDHGELEELLAAGGAAPDDLLLAFQRDPGRGSDSPRPFLCPRCDQRLVEVTAPCAGADKPLCVDRCPRGHGLWFDAGELEALLQAFPPECDTSRTIDLIRDLLGPGAQEQTRGKDQENVTL